MVSESRRGSCDEYREIKLRGSCGTGGTGGRDGTERPEMNTWMGGVQEGQQREGNGIEYRGSGGKGRKTRCGSD